SLASTLEDVKKRDAQDMGRTHAPLRQAEGSTLVESSSLSIEETVSAIVALVHAK
ncbi:MAG: (d)CMP kinase, partial [Polyangiaceae bacterium]